MERISDDDTVSESSFSGSYTSWASLRVLSDTDVASKVLMDSSKIRKASSVPCDLNKELIASLTEILDSDGSQPIMDAKVGNPLRTWLGSLEGLD